MAGADELLMDLAFGDFLIARADERLIGPSGPVKLGRKAFQLLVTLAESDGQLLTKDHLFDTVWADVIVSESALTSVIKELRRALDDPSVQPLYIESVYGRGYRFLPQVDRRTPEVRSSAAPLEPRPPGPLAPPAGEAPLLCVPQFDGDAMAKSDRHFATILHEEVLGALSRFRDVRLVPRAEASETAGERDYRLDVRLLREGEGVRAFARMSRLLTGAIVWADQILLPGDPVAAADVMGRGVAGIALPRLHDDVLRNVHGEAGDMVDLYYALRRRMRQLDSIADAREVAAAWERLIEGRPEFVQAYPPLIRLYNTDYGFTGLGASAKHERSRAYELAHRALAMDPTDAHLHSVKGWCHLRAGEAGLAARHFEEALRLNPYQQARLVELATGFIHLGALERAEELLERCRQLSASPTDLPYEEEGLLCLVRKNHEGAAAALELARCTHPDDSTMSLRPSIWTDLYTLLAAVGRKAPEASALAKGWRARVEAEWAGEGSPDDPQIISWVLFHNPFQGPARQSWTTALLAALAVADRAKPRARGQAHRETPSAPPMAASEPS